MHEVRFCSFEFFPSSSSFLSTHTAKRNEIQMPLVQCVHRIYNGFIQVHQSMRNILLYFFFIKYTRLKHCFSLVAVAFFSSFLCVTSFIIHCGIQCCDECCFFFLHFLLVWLVVVNDARANALCICLCVMRVSRSIFLWDNFKRCLESITAGRSYCYLACLLLLLLMPWW